MQHQDQIHYQHRIQKQNQHYHHIHHPQRSLQQQYHRSSPILDQRIATSLDELVDRLNNPDYNIFALLVGSADGVGLIRSFGSSESKNLSEEIISGVESVWATLPSGSGHHLRPLRMGNNVKMVTAFYDNCTLVHSYLSPLVITFLATPDANVGAIHAMIPDTHKLLEPARQILASLEGTMTSDEENVGKSRRHKIE